MDIPADREAIQALFGELDELIVARILATGASRSELAQAQARLVADDGVELAPGQPPTPRVREIMDVVRTEWDREDREEDANEP